MKNIEIELRYEVESSEQLKEFTAGLTFLGSKRVVDVYLDTDTGYLTNKGVYIRVRNGKKVDIKFNRACMLDPHLEAQPHCEEYTFPLPLMQEDLPKINELLQLIGLKAIDTADFEVFKEVNGLLDDRIVDKTRTSYAFNAFTIALDEVANLGTFLEIELMAESTADLDAITNQMESALAQMSLKRLTTGYTTLLLRKQNFQRYLKSRFILEEDKKYRAELG